MKRRGILLGLTSVIGGGSALWPHVSGPLIEANEELSKEMEEATEESKTESEEEKETIGEIIQWNYQTSQPRPESAPNQYDADAEVTVKNVSEENLDFNIWLTPIHENGDEIETDKARWGIEPAESKVFNYYFGDNSVKYTDKVKITVRWSDKDWFNGWNEGQEEIYEW